MCDMGHEDEEDDDDNINDDDDDDNSGDHVLQQQYTITRGHPRTREGRDRRTREQQSHANLMQ